MLQLRRRYVTKTDKFLLNLGLAHRAGKVVFGFDPVIAAIDKKGFKGIFCSDDAADNTKKRLERACDSAGLNVTYVPYGISEIGGAAGKKDTAVFAVIDVGLHSLLIKSLSVNGGNA